MAKGIRKKITSASNKTNTQELQKWIKSIINHFWWPCSSSKEVKEKWISISSHLPNLYLFEENKIYKRCLHADLPVEELRSKKWIDIYSPAYSALEKVVLDNLLIRDLPYLSEFSHTGNLEVYHSVLLKYCPKMLHFSYIGMVARTESAVLHFNSAMKAGHAMTKDKLPPNNLQYTKVTKSYVIKPIEDIQPKNDIIDLMNTVVSLNLGVLDPILPSTPDIPANITPVEKP